jgi:hypothetical protein
MLFSAGSAYGILSAEVCIEDAQVIKCIDHHCIGFHEPTQYLCSSHGRSDFHRHSLNSFVAISSTSLQRRKEKAMCIVHMRVQCSDTFSEVLAGDVEHTELTIESIVGTALLELFDTVLVENVTVHHSPERNDGDGEQG